jgi:hypothetical protein
VSVCKHLTNEEFSWIGDNPWRFLESSDWLKEGIYLVWALNISLSCRMSEILVQSLPSLIFPNSLPFSNHFDITFP